MDNDVVAGHPVDGGGDLVLVAGDEGVDNAQDLGRVTASGGGVAQDGADGLLGVDDEDGADGEGNALLVDVGGVLVVDPTRNMMLAILLYIHKCATKAQAQPERWQQSGSTYMS